MTLIFQLVVGSFGSLKVKTSESKYGLKKELVVLFLDSTSRWCILLKADSFDVLPLKISRHASTHADPKRLIRTDKWKCAGGYKSGFRRRKVHQILSSSKPSKTMMFRTVIPLLLLLIPLLGCAEAMNENIRACGPNLMEVMIMMCPNGFNGIYQKRDSSEYMLLWFSERHEITRFLVLPYHFQ